MRLRQTTWLLPLLVLFSVFLMTAAIPNVPNGTWQTWNPMGDAGSESASVLLQDGRVLVKRRLTQRGQHLVGNGPGYPGVELTGHPEPRGIAERIAHLVDDFEDPGAHGKRVRLAV